MKKEDAEFNGLIRVVRIFDLEKIKDQIQNNFYGSLSASINPHGKLHTYEIIV